MIKKYMLFFTPACPNCKKIKDFMSLIKLEKELVDASTPNGLERAKEFKIMNVPSVIFFDENNNEVSRAFSVDEVKNIVENKHLV